MINHDPGADRAMPGDVSDGHADCPYSTDYTLCL